jgi:hypothetical protein
MSIFTRIKDNIIKATTLEELFNEIRMRDEEGHPLGYIEHGAFRLEFKRASLRQNCVEADVRIYVIK